MKFALSLIAAAFGAASAAKDITPGASIAADSKMGTHLLSQARRLDDNNENFQWVSGYSIKFQGCHHISQWNEEANGEDEPFIQTKRLVRFRLCPTDSCTYSNASGCKSGYGDYVIDMNTFLEAYWEDRLDNCENYANNQCGCENANNQEYCEYDCFADAGMDYCVDENPYQQDNGDNGNEADDFELEQAMECGQWDVPEQNNGNNNNRRQLDEEELQYFIGPYCSDQGGKIYLGVFTDEFCTNFADDQVGSGSTHLEFYYQMTGTALPYASQSLIDMDCVSCKEPVDQNENNNGNDNWDQDETKEMCEQIYQAAGKCESKIDNAYLYEPNEAACNYIEGIKIVRKDGIVVKGSGVKSKTAAAFIGIFSVSFVLLGAYVYYLKTKLDRSKISLNQ
jgi:hypothetical protein